MERTFQKTSGGIADERFVAGSQNGGAISPRPGLMAGGRPVKLKGLQHAVRESKRLALLGTRALVFAHEIGNPLNAISVGLEFVKRDLESAEFDVRLLIATLQGAMLEIDRLGSLLNEFREIACPQNIDFQRIDLVKNTKEVLFCQYDAYRKLGITVDLQFNSPLLPVMADPGKIKQVVLNLCNNAAQAMPDGGCLTIKGYYLAQKVVLEISDTGTGIPEGLDVFELFRTTKPGGIGVGLPLVRQILAAHHGAINYTSKPGDGTTFTVYLPAPDSET